MKIGNISGIMTFHKMARSRHGNIDKSLILLLDPLKVLPRGRGYVPRWRGHIRTLFRRRLVTEV